MDIKYLGHSSFYLRTKLARVVMDPFDVEKVGIKFPKTEADIVTISHAHPDHSSLKHISNEPLIIDWPGQFEKMGVRISGFSTWHDAVGGKERGENIMYRVEDDISVLHCGDLGAIPDEKLLDEIGEVHVLMVPVGGVSTLDATQAVELIKHIEPSIVIPMHYKVGILQNLAPLEDFLKKIGVGSVQPVQKLTLKKDELTEEMKVVVMEQSQ